MAKKAKRKNPILADSEQPETLPAPGDREKSAIEDSKARVKKRRLRLSMKLKKKMTAGSKSVPGTPMSTAGSPEYAMPLARPRSISRTRNRVNSLML
jgi:hypothetical protein